MHVCDVCSRVDGDFREKLCGYCGLCDAWICIEDVSAWGRRAQAWMIREREGFQA